MKKLKILLSVLAFVTLSVAIVGFVRPTLAKADNEITAAPTAKVWINDLTGFTHSGATYNAQNNDVDDLVSYGRLGYDTNFENVEVSSIINFKTTSTDSGYIVFHLRLQGDVVNASYTNSGYTYLLYTYTSQYAFSKNGTQISGGWTPPSPLVQGGVDHVVKFSTVNLSDGSVNVKLTIDGTVFLDYTDTESPILGAGKYVISTADGTSLSAKGPQLEIPTATDLYDIAVPQTNGNFPGTTINQDNSVSLTSAGIASGAFWGNQQSELALYKFKYTPTTAGGKLHMAIGCVPGTHGFNRLDILDATWGCKSVPYKFIWWEREGILYKNNVNIGYTDKMPTTTAGEIYEIQFGAETVYYGDIKANRITISINGVNQQWLDVESDTNQIITFEKSGTPGALYKYFVIQGEGVNGTIQNSQTATYDEKTLLTSDLGPHVGNATFDSNGAITSMVGGLNAGYNGNFKNTAIKMKGNFASVGSMVLQLRAQGTYDTPWGGGWTNKGYVVYLFSNGQVILAKNGVTICEGWSLGATSMGVNTDYEIEFGTINVSSTAVRVYAKVNGAMAVNYLDTKDALLNEGWFTIFNNAGFAGTLGPVGVVMPSISADKNDAVLGFDTIALTCLINGSEPTSTVNYVINTDKSTATATISENVVTPTSEGTLVIYAIVDGILSNEIVIDVTNPSPIITGAPSSIVYGTTATIDAVFNNGQVANTKVFKIENGSGEASIDAVTGVITPYKAGTVNVYATLNGIDTEKVSITVIPNITLNEMGKLIKGQEASLTYSLNGCPLPEEQISYVYEIVSGTSVASVDATTGALTLLSSGTFTAKVTVNGQTFSAESPLVTVNVIEINLDLPSAPIVVGGEKLSVVATLSDGSAISTLSYGITNVSGNATINAENGEITALGAGTVRVYAVVNGIKTEEMLLTVTPKVFFNKTGAFAFTGRYDLDNFWGANCELPEGDITVTFEIVSGSEYITFDSTTNILVAGSNPGVVGIKIYVNGETFSAVSGVENISIEQPKVIVQNSFLNDLLVGEKVTIVPEISQGGIEITSSRIEIISGKNLVKVDGMTITALKGGLVQYKVIVNDTFTDDDEGLEFSIEPLTATIIANGEIHEGQTQQATLMFNNTYNGLDYEPNSVVWSVVSGAEFLSIDNAGKITGKNRGIATIKAVVDGDIIATLEIEVVGKITLTGVSQNAEVKVGSTMKLWYSKYDVEFEEEPTVSFVVLSGKDCITIDAQGNVTVLKSGDVKIKVIVDDIESQEISFKVVETYAEVRPEDPNDRKEKNHKLAIILGTTIPGAAIIAGGTIFGVKRYKKRKNVGETKDEE